MNRRSAISAIPTTVALFLCVVPALAHRDNNLATNLVKAQGVTVTDNGYANGCPGADAILNPDRTASPQTDWTGAFHSDNRTGPTDLVTLTITFPSAVKFNRVAFNTGSVAGAHWQDGTTVERWWVYVDGNCVVNGKRMTAGGLAYYLHDPYGATPTGDQHELASFAPIEGTQLELRFVPISRAGGWYWSVRDINVWLADDIGVSDYDSSFFMTMYTADCTTCTGGIQEMMNFMGSGGANSVVGWGTGTGYLNSNETYGSGEDWEYNPAVLQERLQRAVDMDVPVIFDFNGGPWMDQNGFYSKFAGDTDYNSSTTNLPFDQNNTAFVSPAPPDAGHCFLTIARGETNSATGTTYRQYKKRNIQAAAWELMSWAHQHPDLFIGVTTDSEISMPTNDSSRWGDYSQIMIRQFRNDEYTKYGGNLSAFNAAMGTSFGSWNAVDPPRNIASPTGAYWDEWKAYRLFISNQMVADTVQWLFEAGIPAKRIFSHQMATLSSDWWGTAPSTALVPRAHVGIDPYGSDSVDLTILDTARYLDRSWGAPEYNPLTPSNYTNTLNALEAAYNRGMHICMPWTWEDVSGLPHGIRNTTSAGAYRDFVNEIIGSPYGSTLWHFNPSGDYEGWTTFHHTDSGYCQDSFRGARVTDYDPYLVGPSGLDFGRADNNQTIEFSMKLDGGGTTSGQIYWITDVDPNWNQNKCVGFTSYGDGVYHTYSVPVPDTARATGRITQFRIDPCSGTSPIGWYCNFDWIRVTPGEPMWEFLPSGDLEGWSAWHDLTSATSSGGVWSSTITGTDPYLGSADYLGYVASNTDHVQIRMKVSGGGTGAGSLGWYTTADYSTIYHGMYYVVYGDDAWHVYDIPVGESDYWYGTIDQIRIDPVSDAAYISHTVEIDYIAISR